jgi:hypothetical protein
MFLTIATMCLVCAACCSFGLEIGNNTRNWWPSHSWIEDHVFLPQIPMRARQVHLFSNALICVGFVFLALWASHYERMIGRAPVLTALCFFCAFINAATSVILMKKSPALAKLGRASVNGR